MTVRLLKLVRGRIPRVIDVDGQRVEYAPIPPDELVAALRRKLGEEVAEYLVAGTLEELADVLEVLRALVWHAHDNTTFAELVDLAASKRDARGGFLEGLGMYGPLRDEELDR